MPFRIRAGRKTHSVVSAGLRLGRIQGDASPISVTDHHGFNSNFIMIRVGRCLSMRIFRQTINILIGEFLADHIGQAYAQISVSNFSKSTNFKTPWETYLLKITMCGTCTWKLALSPTAQATITFKGYAHSSPKEALWINVSRFEDSQWLMVFELRLHVGDINLPKSSLMPNKTIEWLLARSNRKRYLTGPRRSQHG